MDGVVIQGRFEAGVRAEIVARQERKSVRDSRAAANELRRQEEAARRKMEEERDLAAYASSLPETYGSVADALPAAAEAMFNLNRFCKMDECGFSRADAIYGLKNSFIELLYVDGRTPSRQNTTWSWIPPC